MKPVSLDRFTTIHYNKKFCERCNSKLSGINILSWFNDQAICMNCSEAEKNLIDILEKSGHTKEDFIDCGQIPDISDFQFYRPKAA